VRRPGRRELVRTAVAIVAVALGLYGAATAMRRFSGPAGALAESTASAPKVVAVLPLAGAAGDPQTESLAAGVADSLITTLSKVSGLTVVSRAATLKYQDRKLEPDAIARELGATMLVDGRVQRSGDRLRITLSLTQPGAKVVSWQNAYDGTFAEVFTLQREVADAVAGHCGSRWRPPVPPRTRDRPKTSRRSRTIPRPGRSSNGPTSKDNLDRSITLFQSAISRDPRFARAHAGLGEAYWRQYQATRDEKWSVDARDSINEALRLDPQDVSVRLSLAAIYRGMGRVKEATEELRRVTQLHPESDDAHRLLGQLLIDAGQLEAGLTAIKDAIRLRPQYWAHHYGLGSSLYAAGRYREAIPAFQRVVELQPDSSWGYQMLGASSHMLDDAASAKRYYERAILLGNPKAHTNLGTLLYDAGQYDEAVSHHEQATKLQPTSPFNHHNLGDALSRLGRRAEGVAEYRRAEDLCRQRLEVAPRDAATMATLAMLESKLGHPADAERHMVRAVEIEPHSPDVLYAAAVVHALGNRKEKAIDALQQAIDAGYSSVRAGHDPDLAGLKADPRYAAAITSRKTGGGT
jgi:tetratricopeptide (TPR) repeat protein/TolB-like protein